MASVANVHDILCRTADDTITQSIVYPVATAVVVDSLGRRAVPTRCRKSRDSISETESAQACVFCIGTTNRPKKPLLTMTGPVFLEVTRYDCKTHGCAFLCKPSFADLLDKEYRIEPAMIQCGSVRDGRSCSGLFISGLGW